MDVLYVGILSTLKLYHIQCFEHVPHYLAGKCSLDFLLHWDNPNCVDMHMALLLIQEYNKLKSLLKTSSAGCAAVKQLALSKHPLCTDVRAAFFLALQSLFLSSIKEYCDIMRLNK